MKKKLIVRLSKEERQDLTNLVRKGKVAVYRRTHAQVQEMALMCGEPPAGQSRWTLNLLGHCIVEL